MATAKKIKSSTGGLKTDALPESPMLRREPPPEPAPTGWTVGGIPVEQIEGGHRIPYQNTDQGIAEREARPHAIAEVTRDGTGRRRVTGSDIDHQIEERRDFRSNEDFDSFDAPDPMKEIVEAHVPAGMRGKFLNPDKVARDGTRGFEVLKKDGEPIKLGRMVLGVMPEQRAIARNKRYQKLGAAMSAEIMGNFQEEQNRITRDAGGRPGSRRQPDADNGLHETRGESADLLR